MFRDAIINESSFRKTFTNRIRQNLYNYILLDFLPSNYFDVDMDKYTNLDENNYKNLSTRVLYNEMINLKQKLLRTDEGVRDRVEHLMFDMNNEKSYKNFKEDIENINIEALSEMYVRLNEYVSGLSGQGLDNGYRTRLFMFLDRIKKIVALKNRLLYLNKTIKTNFYEVMSTASNIPPRYVSRETWGEVNQNRVKVGIALNTINALQKRPESLQQK